ncbi:MAG: ROK family protein [Cytophagales bacterium]|nr:ROK family protein [Bernardetiaceae bacterium]MDW8205533.1 ROK family protein [Cytophagales bacterium]
MQNFIWGIDLGGTKIEGIVLRSPKAEDVVARLRIDTEAEKGYEHILQQISRLCDQLAAVVGQRPTQIGIGTPGSISPATGLMRNSNTVCLNGKPLHKDLETLLQIPVFIANDANCFALAEAVLGAVPEHLSHFESVFGVIMGTGVGGGIVVGTPAGEAFLLNGKQGICGEWGHNFLDESGGKCYCGKIGCVETILSGTGLQHYYAQISGKQDKLKNIYKRYQQGADPHAKATIERLIHFFGKAIANIVNILDPDAIVLGGGVGNIQELYTLGLLEAKQYIFNPTPELLLLPPKLGDSAGVFGAAMLAYTNNKG